MQVETFVYPLPRASWCQAWAARLGPCSCRVPALRLLQVSCCYGLNVSLRFHGLAFGPHHNSVER